MPFVSLIVATHNKPVELGVCLRSLQLQTFKDFECIVVHEQSDLMWESNRVVIGLKDPRFSFHSYPVNVNDFGIQVKMWATERLANSSVIGHVNGDCYYTPVYLERMAAPILGGKVDFTYCDWVSHKNAYDVIVAHPKRCYIDSAGWLCSKSVVDATPWPVEHRNDGGDGWYVEQLVLNRRHQKVPGVLWVHT